MATQHHPHHDDHHDRLSITPHEAETGHTKALPRWAFGLLGGLALLTGGLTALRMAWQDDQGGAQLSLGSNTEPTSTTSPAPADARPTARVSGELDEDAPLPSAMPFDEYVARTALELRTRGLNCGKPGRVDVKVSFAPSGSSTRAEVVAGRNAATASQCVVGRMTGVTIPAFQGSEERSVQVSLALR
jgi:hypothetical protein